MSAYASLRISTDAETAVATVTLARPERRNALDLAAAGELFAALEAVRSDAAVRAVVLTGEGAGFCAGADLLGVDPSALADPAPVFRRNAGALHEVVTLLRRIPKPVVAAVNGAAAGAGFGLALACDLRVGGPSTRFVTAFTKIALSPDSSTSFWLPRFLGPGKAAEVLMLSDPISARDAAHWLLLNRLTDTDEAVVPEATALAARLAAMPAGALARAKALVSASLDRPLEAHLQEERELVAQTSTTADFREGVAAFIGKRAPRFNEAG